MRGFFTVFKSGLASNRQRLHLLATTKRVIFRPRLLPAGEPHTSIAVASGRALSDRWPNCYKNNSPCDVVGFLSRFRPMKRRNRWLVPYLAAVVALFIRAWMSTMRTRMIAADGQQHPV